MTGMFLCFCWFGLFFWPTWAWFLDFFWQIKWFRTSEYMKSLRYWVFRISMNHNNGALVSFGDCFLSNSITQLLVIIQTILPTHGEHRRLEGLWSWWTWLKPDSGQSLPSAHEEDEELGQCRPATDRWGFPRALSKVTESTMGMKDIIGSTWRISSYGWPIWSQYAQ